MSTTKDKIIDEQKKLDAELERINVDSKALLVKTPFDNLKIKKNLDQLYQAIKRKSEDGKPIAEEIRAQNIYRLSQLGIECSKMAQALNHEKYFINKKREDKLSQSITQFVTNLGEDYDSNVYLQKYTDFQLFNLTDNAFVNDKNRTQKRTASKLSKLWANDVKQLISSKKDAGENLIPGNTLFPKGARNLIKKTGKGIDGKKANYLNGFNKYMRVKYLDRDDLNASVSLMIEDFIAFTRADPEVCEIWKILLQQILTFEECVRVNENQKENILNAADCQANLIHASCKILEDEFVNAVMSLKGQNFIGMDVPGVRSEDMNFIIQEYLKSNFIRRNYIQFDDKSFPVWAFCFVLFRSGRLEDLHIYLEKYQGSLKEETMKLRALLADYVSHLGFIPQEACQDLMRTLDTGEEDIDVFRKMLYCVILRSQEVPTEDLLANLGDYLWFNLKICSVGTGANVRTLSEIRKEIVKMGPEYFNPDNGDPFNYVKTLFLTLAYDEALHYLRGFEECSEEFIHFAISLYESKVIRLNEREANFFKEGDYYCEVIKYATSFCEKNPLEAALYLRLLYSEKSNVEDSTRKKQIIETISNFIINNDQISFFFDKKRDSQRNARYLEDIVGNDLYKFIVFEIANHYKKSNLTFALDLLDRTNFKQEVLELILQEEYKNLKVFRDRSKGRDISVAKSQYEPFIKNLLDNYYKNNILNEFRFLYASYEFVKKVRTLWESFARKNYNDSFELLKKWDNEWYIFGYNPRDILEEFKTNLPIVQKCYMHLLTISLKIITEYVNYIKMAPKSQEHIKIKIEDAQRLWNRIKNFYKKIRNELAVDSQNLHNLDKEFSKDL